MQPDTSARQTTAPAAAAGPGPASGRPASTRERGTVLLLIVGVLAMLSIIAVVYAAIGRADRLSSTAYRRETSVDEFVRRVAEYHQQILVDDLFDFTVVLGVDPNNPTNFAPVPIREMWDRPSIATGVVTQSVRFSPSGTASGTDPYLASTLPDLNPTTNPNGRYRWPHISNVAPGGQFINLWNLRGNLEAPAGVIGQTMSRQLQRIESNGNQVQMNAATSAPNNAAVNYPALLTANQYETFAPATWTGRFAPNDPRNWRYSWLDVDGDGFYDSRPWLPEDATDFYLGTPPASPRVRQVIPFDGPYRYVLGTRIIDLSSMVNVNTGLEFDSVPNKLHPAGVSPADVNLQALLSLGGLDPSMTDGYSGIDTNYFTGEQVYADYDLALAKAAGNKAFGRIAVAVGHGPISDAEDRMAAYERFATGPSGLDWAVDHGTSLLYYGSQLNPFGASSELDLRAFHGVNNPALRSRLKATIAGTGDLTNDPLARRLDPLRSWRSLYHERGQRDMDADGRIDDAAMNQVRADVRSLLTTAGASRPLAVRLSTPGRFINGTFVPRFDELTEDDVKINIFKEAFEFAPPLTPGGEEILTGLSDAGIQRVFDAVMECLAPFATVPATWDQSNTSRTASYGGNAEFALRAGLHWLVNLLDAYDADQIPTRFTIKLRTRNGTDIFEPTTEDEETPYVKHDSSTASAAPSNWRTARLEMPRDAAGTPKQPENASFLHTPHWYNVYGIEPQPMLTEVTSFTLFTDSPTSTPAAMYGQGGDDEWNEAGVDPADPTSRDTSVGVTLNNTVDLANPDFVFEVIAFQVANPFDQTIRIGVDDDTTYYVEYAGRYYPLVTTGGTPVVLGPGAMHVFYVTSQVDHDALRTRVATALGDSSDTGAFGRFVAGQFGVDEEDSTRIEAYFHSPAYPNLDLTTLDTSTTLLDLHGDSTGLSDLPQRRRVVNLWRAVIEGDETRNENDLRNDILVDRLRDAENGPVQGLNTRSMLTSVSVIGRGEFDEDDADAGLSMLLWRGWTRPSWSTDPTGKHGAMPPWAIEVPPDYRSNAGEKRRNDNYSADASEGTLASYVETGPQYFRSLNALFDWYGADPDTQQAQHPPDVGLWQRPDVKDRNQLVENTAGGRSFDQAAVELHSRTSGPNATTPRNPGLFLRQSDLMKVLAVGPWHAPGSSAAPPGSAQALEDEWMTLSEALALAMGYYSPSNPMHPLYVAADGDVAAAIPQKLDRGHLMLHGHVPFIDNSGNGQYDLNEDVLGLGVPLAWGLLDRFRVDDVGSLTVGKPGMINVSTAPLRVLRMVPMLSPPTDMSWWGRRAMESSRTVQGWLARQPDPAASIVAYRDRTQVQARDGTVLNFDPATLPMRLDEKVGILGLRDPRLETTGFVSLGEILAARDVTHTSHTQAIHDIDYFALATDSIAAEALDPTRYRGGVEDDGMKNDFDEQLAIVDAAINSLTIRSDVFCVWFVVQGYLPSDVEGLSDDDPMVPSLARRYVMVVDRSNVTKRGQKPRVLFLQEVPM